MAFLLYAAFVWNISKKNGYIKKKKMKIDRQKVGAERKEK